MNNEVIMLNLLCHIIEMCLCYSQKDNLTEYEMLMYEQFCNMLCKYGKIIEKSYDSILEKEV